MRMWKRSYVAQHIGPIILSHALGLRNVPPTFTTFKNANFQKEINDFVIVYINVILVYFKIAKEYVQFLEMVFGKLRDNKLYANKQKNGFANKRLNS